MGNRSDGAKVGLARTRGGDGSTRPSARLEDAETIKVWANMWRGLPDTDDDWPSILKNVFLSHRMA